MIYIHSFNESTQFELSSVGGKGDNLIKLSKLNGIKVPDGFCVTTGAYKKTFGENAELNSLLDHLSLQKKDEMDNIRTISAQIRSVIENKVIPEDITEAITAELKECGEDHSYAVRSSATAEDLPTASFAGQHDTYLNIIGRDSILKHISKCWASLFTERAVSYRIQNNFDHAKVFLAVVIQPMLIPESSGIMFTADPLTSNRKVLSIDASYGLGEAIVSGLVSPDIYKVRGNKIINKKIAAKNIAIYALEDGGIEERKIEPDLINKQTLTDEQILRLEQTGRQIETYFSCPQDIEWCLSENQFYIVQSRPITTLYPIPKVTGGEAHVFLSSGHMQMMTAPIKPLGMSFFKSVLGLSPSQEIGGRLYADMTHDLATPLGRIIAKSFISMVGDDLITNAITQIINNKKLIKTLPKGKDKVIKPENNSGVISIMLNAYKIFKKNDPDIIKGLTAKEDNAIEKMKEEIEKLSGNEVIDYIEKDHDKRRQKIATPANAGALTAVLLSEKWFSRKIKKWLGIKNAADTFLMSIPNSITAETGFGLLDVADTIRDYPEIIDYLNNPNDETFFEDIAKFTGGESVCKSIQTYLSKYGMRCSGDIDITVPRWSEKPTEIVPIILSNIKNFGPNASKLKFDQGITESMRRIDELAGKVKKLPGGRKKAERVRRIAGLIRNYIGYREYPKFSYMKRYFIYKQAMLKEAARLLDKGIIKELEDVYYLYFDELKEVVNTGRLDYSIIESRKKDYKGWEKLTPPRVMTSEGEIISGEYDTADIPKDALPGIAVSAGIIEGRAKVVYRFQEAELEDGDILVTEFTDPSWTPLFVSIKGLVTEVGGLVTHGAIIAREYGLPAVVSVENATRLIKDGQMIRVNGTEGYIEILS
ncbi:MAG: phosphoenolpyruvate synthase [Spirochaetales bacterium]|nr:phosphoenolpyruvate synthase [Spirochaetales bacterium]